jgi:nucleoid-associated protein YgaU
MGKVSIRGTSRLKFSRLVTTGGVDYWELPEFPSVDPAPDDILYTVARKDRIDNLANEHYGDPTLWWIIALANGFRLLPTDMRENMQIRIPNGKRVFTDILRKASRGEEGR